MWAEPRAMGRNRERAGRRVTDLSEDERKHVLTPEQQGAGKRGVCKGAGESP